MSFIVEISGYKAVGKSTLTNNLKKRFPNAIFREGFRKFNKDCNLQDYNDYINNQKLYIKREIEEFKELRKSNRFVFLLRGPEEVGFFTRMFPKLKYHLDWDINENVIPELSELDTMRSDVIIWLDAPSEVLEFRKENDKTKPRLNMEKWNKTWNPYLGNFIKSLAHTKVIDTTKLDSNEVLRETVNLVFNSLDKNIFIPERLYIETTNACNARCIMCPHSKMKRNIQTMDCCTFNSVLEQLKPIDLSNTSIFMHKEGEPFLDNRIIERISAIKINTNAKEVVINTNASLLNEDLSSQLLDTGIDTVYLSIDGTQKETYEKIRVGLNYDVVIENVKGLLKLISEKQSKTKVIIQMLVNDSNKDEGQVFKSLWETQNCEVFIKNMHSYLDGGNSSLTTEISSTQLYSCTDPFDMLVIYSNGNFGCCCWDYENELYLGNIKEKAIIDVFNSNEINEIRRKHSNFECKSLNPCNRCMRIFGNDEIGGISNGKEIKIK